MYLFPRPRKAVVSFHESISPNFEYKVKMRRQMTFGQDMCWSVAPKLDTLNVRPKFVSYLSNLFFVCKFCAPINGFYPYFVSVAEIKRQYIEVKLGQNKNSFTLNYKFLSNSALHETNYLFCF